MQFFAFNYDDNSKKSGFVIWFQHHDDMIGFDLSDNHPWYLKYRNNIFDKKNQWRYKCCQSWILVEFCHHSHKIFLQWRFPFRSAYSLFCDKMKTLLGAKPTRILCWDECNVTDLEFSWIIKSLLWTFQKHKMQSGSNPLKVTDLLHELTKVSFPLKPRDSLWDYVGFCWPHTLRNPWQRFQDEAHLYPKVVNILIRQLQDAFGIKDLVDLILGYSMCLDWPYKLIVWIGWLDPQ